MRYTVQVPSSELWVDTGVIVFQGNDLTFRATGIWWDAYIPCSADGYPARLFYALHRPPRIPDEGRFFRLMGRVMPLGEQPGADDAAQTFVIGRQSQRRFDCEGRLYVFCNDRAGYYGNNWCAVSLSITSDR